MVRGTGKFKTRRGGGRSFSRDMELDHNGIAESRSSRRKNRKQGENGDDEDEEEDVIEEGGEGERDDDDDDDEEDDEDEDEAEGEGNDGQLSTSAKPELTRTERRELKRKQAAEKQARKQTIDEDDEDDDLINPNHVEKKLNITDLGSRELTRKERDAKEKQEAKSRYWKLHVAGKTDEAKADLARLKKIREEREAAQAKRKAEAEAKKAEIEAKKIAAMSGKRV